MRIAGIGAIAAPAFCAAQAAEEPQAVQEPRVPFGVIIAEQARASFTLRGAGARAAGMGGAFTAVADDATAASFNPGGKTQIGFFDLLGREDTLAGERDD